jgi:hypothetical protein
MPAVAHALDPQLLVTPGDLSAYLVVSRASLPVRILFIHGDPGAKPLERGHQNRGGAGTGQPYLPGHR